MSLGPLFAGFVEMQPTFAEPCANGARKESHSRPVMNVLLIDDEPEICFLVRNVLLRAGIQCQLAHSIAEGRKKLEAGNFLAVMLDIHLPDGKGYQLIPEIRAVQPGARVIAISAVDQERENATGRGADLFIAKPFNRSSILGGLRALGITA